MGVEDVFSALAHSGRRSLIEELRCGPQPAGSLGQGLDMSREAVSKHLRLMVQTGVLHVESKGRERWYALNTDALAIVDDWLEPYRHFWTQHLDALDTEIARGLHAEPATAEDTDLPTAPLHHAQGA